MSKARDDARREEHRVFWTGLDGQIHRPTYLKEKPVPPSSRLFAWCKCGAWTETNRIPGVAVCHRCRKRSRQSFTRACERQSAHSPHGRRVLGTLTRNENGFDIKYERGSK